MKSKSNKNAPARAKFTWKKFLESKEWQLHLILLPAVIVVFIYSYIPLYGIVIAFQKFTPATGFSSPWVGLSNFEFLFRQPNFVRTIGNTLYIAVFKLVLTQIVSILFALMLNEVKCSALKRSVQTVAYIPNFLSWVVLAGMLIDILSTDGLLNQITGLFGAKPVSFLGNPKVFPWTMIISDIWKNFGYGAIIYLAALTSVDPGLYEAAALDGAGRFRRIWHVTLPAIAPTIILMSLLSLGSLLNAGFEQIYNLYSPSVYQTGDIIDTYMYRLGMIEAQYSFGTAVGLFKSVISCFLISVSYWAADKFAGYRIL
ncbi:MAG: sugar ABC transporter permease [Lachnospiraceae bacterium]|nr:sugar ABC transporter permease [Lachnospiraceae bacterium]